MPFHNVGTQCTIVFIACQLDLSSLCNIYGSETAATHIALSLSLHYARSTPSCLLGNFTHKLQPSKKHPQTLCTGILRSLVYQNTDVLKNTVQPLAPDKLRLPLGLGADVSRLVGQRETLEFRANGFNCNGKSLQQTNKQRCVYTKAKAKRV